MIKNEDGKDKDVSRTHEKKEKELSGWCGVGGGYDALCRQVAMQTDATCEEKGV